MSKRALGSQYLLDEQIGRGGMGTVWVGQDRTTGASYAIKVLHQSFASDPAAVARFVRERTALISFRHPHVVTVHDMVVERDTLALVMDLIPGGDLSRLRRDHGGRIELRQALELTAQIADALAAAHAAGIVHRDIKPANILLRSGYDALLADFGIAYLAAQSRDTTTGMVLGTAEYLAPELIAGEDPGPAGDLYALGVTLYELVAGAPPFTGNPAAVLHAHVADVPARPAGMDDGLWEVVSHCLEKDPARRPSAAAFADVLRRLASGNLRGYAGSIGPATGFTGPITGPATGPATSPAGGRGAGQYELPGSVAGQYGTTGSATGQYGVTGSSTGQYGLSSPFHQVRMQPLSETAQPEAGPARRSLPHLSRKAMVITASVVAVLALTGAVVLADPFGSSATQNTSGGLAAPTVSSGASAAATGTAQSSAHTGTKQGGTGAQAADASVSGTSGTGGAHPSSGAPTHSSGGHPGSSATATSGTDPSSSATATSSAAHPSSSGTAPSAVTTSPGTTDADGFAILDASTSDVVHHCEQLGIDRRGYQAIVCLDIDTYTSGSDYYAVGKVEAYCQTIAAASAQCVHITVGGTFANGGGTQTNSWSCSSGGCPNGRLAETVATFTWSDSNSANCSNGTSPENDVWDEVAGLTTSIELPVSDATYTLNASDGGNDGDSYSSGHYWVCQS